MIWERVYDILLKRQDPETQKRLSIGQSIDEATNGEGLEGVSGQMHDDHQVWKGDRPADEDGNTNTDKVTESQVKDMIREAYVQSSVDKNPGKMPAHMRKMIDEYLNPRMPWQRLVQNYLKPADGWFGYQPGDTRFADPVPWFIPDHKLRYILITIDTSGSMSDAEVAQAIAEARHLLRGFPQTKGILCMCDYGVSYWESLDKTYTLQHRSGYGGTSFEEPFKEVIKRGLKDQIDLHIYFTDGYGSFPTGEWLKQNKIMFDTLWVITNDQSTPPQHRQYRFTRLGGK
jgi:predicted metal-dependent peptidase